MDSISSMILFIWLVLLHSGHSFSRRADDNETTIPFTVDMLPILNSFTPINASSIELIWSSSPAIEGLDLSQLSGLFTVVFFLGSRGWLQSIGTIYLLTRLNETRHSDVLAKLKPDTVHYACFHSKWNEINTPIDTQTLTLLSRRECRLVRTYMEDQTTLKSVPPFGEYTWNEVTTNSGISAIVISASVSSELPYYYRNITVTLGSKIQNRVFTVPTEVIQFEFEHNSSKSTDYPLSITFLLYDVFVSNLSVATNTLRGRVITTPTTTSFNMGNKRVLSNIIFLIFLSVLALF